jgi:ribonuclease D
LGEEAREEEPVTEPFLPPPPSVALTVAQERRLRVLEEERKRVARLRGVAPRRIATDEALRALARGVEPPEGVAAADAGRLRGAIDDE